jgi:hypothetical protein
VRTVAGTSSRSPMRACGVAGLCAGAPPRATPPSPCSEEERGGGNRRPGGPTKARKPATPPRLPREAPSGSLARRCASPRPPARWASYSRDAHRSGRQGLRGLTEEIVSIRREGSRTLPALVYKKRSFSLPLRCIEKPKNFPHSILSREIPLYFYHKNV